MGFFVCTACDNPKKMNKIYLISCVSKKKSYPVIAKGLYISTWFKKAKTYINQYPYYILSAKYGLLHPEKIIEPYNLTLNNMRVQERKVWAYNVHLQITKTINTDTIIFLAGKRYREFLIPLLKEHYNIEIPLLGLGIGQQLKWFNENTSCRNNG